MESEIPAFFKETEKSLEKLILLFERENKLLNQKKYTEADTIIEEKEVLFQKIEKVDQQLSGYLASINIPGTPQALSKYISQRLPGLQGQLLTRQWQNIIELLSQVETFNIQNGIVINSAKEHTQKIVEILLGKINTNLYIPE